MTAANEEATMPGIGIITNLNSRRNKTGAYSQEKMSAIVGPQGFSRDTRTLNEIPPIIREFRDKEVEIICINGGDGTQHYVTNEIVKEYGEKGPFPAIVPLRGGVMNMLAKNFNIKGNPAKTLIAVKNLYLLNKGSGGLLPVKKCWTLHVSSPAMDKSRLGFVYGTGIGYKLLLKYYGKGVPTFRDAFNVVASTVYGFILGSSTARSDFEHTEARITVEGRQLPFPTMLIVVASVIPNLVLWFKPFREKEKAGEKPWFYLLAMDIDNWEVIKNLRTLSRGTFPPHEKIFNDPASSAKIESDCGFTLDGELFHVSGKSEVTIAPGPSLNFLAL